MQEFEVNEGVTKGKVNTCLVCEQKFKLGENIVLVPIQGVKEGWGDVMSIPVHSKCYWVKE